MKHPVYNFVMALMAPRNEGYVARPVLASLTIPEPDAKRLAEGLVALQSLPPEAIPHYLGQVFNTISAASYNPPGPPIEISPLEAEPLAYIPPDRNKVEGPSKDGSIAGEKHRGKKSKGK